MFLDDILSNIWFFFVSATYQFPTEEELWSKVDNLEATENWESGEESHCASNQTQLCNQSHLEMIFFA